MTNTLYPALSKIAIRFIFRAHTLTIIIARLLLLSPLFDLFMEGADAAAQHLTDGERYLGILSYDFIEFLTNSQNGKKTENHNCNTLFDSSY